MKVGDLVKTTRASTAGPIDSLGLVVGAYVETGLYYSSAHDDYSVCRVFMFSKERIRRVLPCDLEVLEVVSS